MVFTLLESGEIRARTLPLTVAQYHVLVERGLVPDNTELLEGFLIRKEPKTPLHCSVLRRMWRRLERVQEPEYEVRPQQPLTCRDSEPEPDLALVTVSPDDYASAHPTSARLAAEVSIASVDIDRCKTTIYAAAGVEEYWIILPELRQVEVYSRLRGERYSTSQVFSDGETVASVILPELRVALPDLFPG